MSYFGKISKAAPGTIRTSNIIDFTGDAQGRTHETHEGYYVWVEDGSLAGPFESMGDAAHHYTSKAFAEVEEVVEA